MRLKKLQTERRLLRKLMPWKTQSERGESTSDVSRVMGYRSELFGKHFYVSMRALRGPCEWSVGERQLFAASGQEVTSIALQYGSSAARTALIRL